ncbi:MAG: response regulator transcription factor [Gordonia sp. (in: high G+C Gram-positive bacteria)]
MIRVVIVDDQEMIRVGLRGILESHPDIEVVAEAADGLSAVAVVTDIRPDVVLMDIRMPGIDGVEAIKRIREDISAEDVRILVLTTFEHDDNVLRALKVGADGFFGKGASPVELIDGVRRIAAGHNVLSPNAINAVVSHVGDERPIALDGELVLLFETLTTREREVVGCVVAGMTNAQIADRLFLSPFTVKTHVTRAMTKVGAHDRAQLVTKAFQAGIRP